MTTPKDQKCDRADCPPSRLGDSCACRKHRAGCETGTRVVTYHGIFECSSFLRGGASDQRFRKAMIR